MAKTINLNADMGESFGAYDMGDDQALLDIVNSANIACGFHASDPWVMRQTVCLAKDKNVSIGAHPSFPDLQGFGRRRMDIAPDELEAMIIYQIGALEAIARTQGINLSHVKPHGALNNMACEDIELAHTIARAVKAIDPSLILLAPIGSYLYQAGLDYGLSTAGEIFADRSYDAQGNLTPRSQKDAIIHDPRQSLDQILNFLESDSQGEIQSICVHGDTENTVILAQAIKTGLQNAGFELVALQKCLDHFAT